MTTASSVLTPVIVWTALCASLSAQPGYVQLQPNNAPPARNLHCMEPDGLGLIMVGGKAPGTVAFGDCWTFRSGDWQQVTTAPLPSPRFRGMMAYDPARGITVLFGGRDASNMDLADTWEWNGITWTQASPPVSPPARRDGGLAYSSTFGGLILFGGRGPSGGFLADTWLWDGFAWTELTALLGAPPAGRYSPAMAFDAARDRLVMHGGVTSGGPPANADLWELGPVGGWTQIPHATTVPRKFHRLTYDPNLGGILLPAGNDGPGLIDETWIWDGTDWTQVSTAVSPGLRANYGLAYLAAEDVTIFFAGNTTGGARFSDTWAFTSQPEWQTNQPAASLTFGSGSNTTYTGAIRSLVQVGQPESADLASDATGQGWDVYITSASPVGASFGGLALPGDQVFNLPLGNALPLLGGSYSLPWSVPSGLTLTVPLDTTSISTFSAQLVTLTPGSATGFALSAANTLEVVNQQTTYTEDFESLTLNPVPLMSFQTGILPAGWSDGGGLNPWVVWDGSATLPFGVPGDHTSGSGNYFIADPSFFGGVNNSFVLETGALPIPASGQAVLDFWYYLDSQNLAANPNAGTLEIQENPNGTGWSTIASYGPGNQGQAWLNGVVPLTATGTTTRLRFRYSFTGPPAPACGIDDLIIRN